MFAVSPTPVFPQARTLTGLGGIPTQEPTNGTV